jgi:hypothetical protein
LLKGFDKKGHASELLFSDECKSAWKEEKEKENGVGIAQLGIRNKM